METFNFKLTNNSMINFPEPFNGGWLKSYTEQVSVKKDSNIKRFGLIKFFDKSHMPISFKFEKN